MKTLVFWALLIFFCATVQAQVAFNGDITATSLYTLRGIQQTDGAALQLGLTAKHPSGGYARIWGTNVDKGPANRETAFILGYQETRGRVTWEVLAAQHRYNNAPSSAALDFRRVTGFVTYKWQNLPRLTSGVMVIYWPDFPGQATDEALYVRTLSSFSLTQKARFTAHLGYHDISGGQDRTDIGFGFSYNLSPKLRWGLDYEDTDDGFCGSRCGPHVIGKVAYNF